MGYVRPKPERLAEKLLKIRMALALSQGEMLKRLEVQDLIWYTKISAYELGKREPTLTILLQYARVANVCADVLIDDELDLPEVLPSPTKHEGVRRKSAAPRGKRR